MTTTTPARGRRRAGSALGDALRALAELRPETENAAAAILSALHLQPRAGRVAPAGHAEPSVAEPTLDAPVPRTAAKPSHDGVQQERLPPVVQTSLEQIDEPASPPPTWLEEAPLIPLPASSSGPIRYRNPPFHPRWQRAILSRLSSTIEDEGELDVDAVVARIANALPLVTVPRRRERSVARGVQLLVDRGESMEPYQLDVARFVAAMRRTIGAGAVSVLWFKGHPDWGCESGIDVVDYRVPPPGVPVVILSDFGIMMRSSSSAAGEREWVRFFGRLGRRGHPCTGIVPLRSDCFPAALSRAARLIAWERSTRVSQVAPESPRVAGRISAPETNRDHAMDELLCAASLPTRLEPQLLRALRLEVCRDVPIHTEADLWFSDFVEDRSLTGIVLSAAVTRRATRRHVLGPHLDRSRAQQGSLRSQNISKLHAWFEYDPSGKLLVADAGSKNGTQVGGERLAPREPVPVANGTEIRFGPLEAMVCSLEQFWEVASLV